MVASIYVMVVETGDHITSYITVTVCRVKVMQEHDWAANFDLKFVLWHPRDTDGVQGFHGVLVCNVCIQDLI